MVHTVVYGEEGVARGVLHLLPLPLTAVQSGFGDDVSMWVVSVLPSQHTRCVHIQSSTNYLAYSFLPVVNVVVCNW